MRPSYSLPEQQDATPEPWRTPEPAPRHEAVCSQKQVPATQRGWRLPKDGASPSVRLQRSAADDGSSRNGKGGSTDDSRLVVQGRGDDRGVEPQ